MKITKKTKNLFESKKLVEADEEEAKAVVQQLVDDPNTGTVEAPAATSVDEIATEVQKSTIADTKGQETVSDEQAKAVATDIKAAASAIDAKSAIIAEPFK